MLVVDQVAEFMDDDVFDAGFGALDQFEVEHNFAIGGTTAPTFVHLADQDFRARQLVGMETRQNSIQEFRKK